MPSERNATQALADSAHAEAGAPVKNELLDRLDAALKDRALALVEAALGPAEKEAGDVIARALSHVTGGSFRALIAAQMMEATNRIRAEAAHRTYGNLLEETLRQITPKAA